MQRDRHRLKEESRAKRKRRNSRETKLEKRLRTKKKKEEESTNVNVHEVLQFHARRSDHQDLVAALKRAVVKGIQDHHLLHRGTKGATESPEDDDVPKVKRLAERLYLLLHLVAAFLNETVSLF
jgi:hypothetical protein